MSIFSKIKISWHPVDESDEALGDKKPYNIFHAIASLLSDKADESLRAVA